MINESFAVRSVYDVVHYYNIKVIDKNREKVEFISWQGLRWELRIKYDWYFKYRAALMQVKYPKFEVQIFSGKEPATGKSLEEIRQLRIRAKKAKITEFSNKLKKLENDWSSVYPIEILPDYHKSVQKLKRLEFELLAL